MGTLKGFLNPKKVENIKFVVSNRFVDDDGNPLEWELRALSAKESELLQPDCMIKKASSRRGVSSLDLDAALYTKKMMAKCVVKPDLNEIDIQDAYGVSCAEDVLGNMLTSGEYTALSNKLLDVNGFNEIFEDEVKEAKN